MKDASVRLETHEGQPKYLCIYLHTEKAREAGRTCNFMKNVLYSITEGSKIVAALMLAGCKIEHLEPMEAVLLLPTR